MGSMTAMHVHRNNATETMRIDSSGNLLVGKTAASGSTQGAELRADGRLLAVSTSDFAGYFNRKTTDGEIVRFVKDTTTVGSIGSTAGSMYIEGNPATSKVGLTFFGSTIEPRDAGAASDGDVDLGASTARLERPLPIRRRIPWRYWCG
jgi:hypothetical protein